MVEIAFSIPQVFYIPRGFTEPYTNITKFTVESCHLKEIRRSDWSQFPQLRTLVLQDNDLEVLEEDLFQSNLMLENVNLRKNKIWFIGGRIFENLKRLKLVSLEDNFCIRMILNSANLNGDWKVKCSQSHWMDESQTTPEDKEKFDWISLKIDNTFIAFAVIGAFVFLLFPITFCLYALNNRKLRKLKKQIVKQKQENMRVALKFYPLLQRDMKSLPVLDYEPPMHKVEEIYEELLCSGELRFNKLRK